MAFPETAVVSTFTGAVSITPVTGFSNMTGAASCYGSANDGSIVSATASRNYWNAGTYTQPVDIDCRCVANGGLGSRFGVVLAQNPGASWNGYEIRWFRTSGSTGNFQIFRCDAGVFAQLGADSSATFLQGDTIGARIHTLGNIDLWHKIGTGAWTKILTRNDTTYSGQFYGGYVMDTPKLVSDGFNLDDLGIGNAVEDEASAMSHLFSGKFGSKLMGKLA